VKVYTINSESKFLHVSNVALGNVKDLIQLFAKFGEIEEYRLLDEDNPDPYTDWYRIKFSTLDSARAAKLNLNKSSFIGHTLQVSYSPECESIALTHEKLDQRKQEVVSRLDPIYKKLVYEKSDVNSMQPPLVGPTVSDQPRNVSMSSLEKLPILRDESVRAKNRKPRINLTESQKVAKIHRESEHESYQETARVPTTENLGEAKNSNLYSDMTPSMQASILTIREQMQIKLKNASRKRKEMDSAKQDKEAKQERKGESQ